MLIPPLDMHLLDLSRQIYLGCNLKLNQTTHHWVFSSFVSSFAAVFVPSITSLKTTVYPFISSIFVETELELSMEND